MNASRSEGNHRRFWKALLRRGPAVMEIKDYHAGNVEVEQPVTIAPQAAVAGNVTAPQVTVAGLLYGSVVTQTLVVVGGGQIWGDVCVQDLEIKPGGKVRGWIHTVDEVELHTLRNGQEQEEVVAPELPPQLAALQREREGEGADRGDVLHLLQTEAGAALLARQELERTFEARVTEVAEDAVRQAQSLDARLADARDEIAQLHGQVAEKTDALQANKAQLESQAEELERVRELLEEQTEAGENARQVLEEKTQRLATAKATNESLGEQIRAAIAEADALSARVENLESALQDSVQHSAEQEAALLRWQELAEDSQQRIKELEDELQEARMEAEEGRQLTEVLRLRRKEADQALQQVLEELYAVRSGEENALPLPEAETEADVEQVLARMAFLQETDEDAEGRAVQAQDEMREAASEAKASDEQLLWYKTSLKTAQAQLQSQEEQLQEQLKLLESLREEVREHQALAEKWKANVGRLSELLYEATQHVRQKEEEIDRLRDELATVRRKVEQFGGKPAENEQSLQQLLRERAVHIQAMEEEVDHFHEELEAQGERLAQAHAALAEVQMELEQAKGLLAERTEEGNRIRQMAAKRIRQLEEDLAKSQQQLKDLMAWVDRQRGRD